MGSTAGKPANNSSIGSSQKKKMSAVSSGGYIRRAHHSGSWYTDDPATLKQELVRYLQKAASTSRSSSNETQQEEQNLRGIICPHAGFSYSGPTAAYSYLALQHELMGRSSSSQPPNHATPSPIRHILVLHPSHHVYLNGCAVSGASLIETPLGQLTVDDDLRQEILDQDKNDGGGKDGWEIMQKRVDEREHSGEMQYPFLAHILHNGGGNLDDDAIKVLPIMCGNLSPRQEARYGRRLAPIVARPDVLCVVSSDFCHWGSRFQYQPSPATTRKGATSSQEIFEYIQELDRQGMDHIELQDPGAFATYLKQTSNTICGRHAIGVWLHAIQSTSKTLDVSFVRYAQSSEVTSMSESSVSYASAVARSKRP